MATVVVGNRQEIWNAEALAEGSENSTVSDVYTVEGEKRLCLSLKVDNDQADTALVTGCVLSVHVSHDASKFYLYSTITCSTSVDVTTTRSAMQFEPGLRYVRVTAVHPGGYSVSLTGDISASRL